MTDKNLLFILFSAIILISSCDEQLPEEEAISDPITNPQFVFMRESNLLYFAASYELEFEGESLTSSMVEWLGQGGTVQDTIWLNDQGNSGDIIYDDGLYSSQIINESDYLSNTLDSSNVGSVNCTFIGIYGTKKSEISYFNYPPEINSLTIPDSIVRPLGEEIDMLLIVAEVIDDNGPACNEVKLQIDISSSPLSSITSATMSNISISSPNGRTIESGMVREFISGG
jgi:hypothetical protein